MTNLKSWRDSKDEKKDDADADDSGDARCDPAEVLDRILDGVRRPFRVRVDQALTVNPREGEIETTRFALYSLLAFYEGVFAKLVGGGAEVSSLAAAAGECASAARDAFEEAVARRGEKLKKHPPSVPDDLGAPACVAETAARVAALLEAEGEGADAGDAGGGDRAAVVAAAVASMLDPALEACELAAASLDDALAQERDGRTTRVGRVGRFWPTASRRRDVRFACRPAARSRRTATRSSGARIPSSRRWRRERRILYSNASAWGRYRNSSRCIRADPRTMMLIARVAGFERACATIRR
jgi:hypothetical protein